MAINYPGPYELRIKYTPSTALTPTLEHIQRLNVALDEPAAQGDTFANYTIEDIDGVTTTSLATLTEDWLTLMLAVYHTSAAVVGVELWKYPTAQSFDSVFWSSYTPTANAGLSGTAARAAGQNIFSFRTKEGGTQKLSLMESIQVEGPPQAYATLSAANAAMVDFLLDGDGVNYSAPFLGRDTSYPFAFNKMFPGVNEATWKKRNGR